MHAVHGADAINRESIHKMEPENIAIARGEGRERIANGSLEVLSMALLQVLELEVRGRELVDDVLVTARSSRLPTNELEGSVDRHGSEPFLERSLSAKVDDLRRGVITLHEELFTQHLNDVVDESRRRLHASEEERHA